MLSTMSMATLEATVPIWILDTMNAEKWELGMSQIYYFFRYILLLSLRPMVVKLNSYLYQNMLYQILISYLYSLNIYKSL